MTTGLAWTETGGDLLSIEALQLPGKGRMKSTGKLGEVMKESIDAASSFVRSKSPTLGIKPPLFEKLDIHVHVPEGATPKDGPSAGIAMVTSIVSVLLKFQYVEIAMTGSNTTGEYTSNRRSQRKIVSSIARWYKNSTDTKRKC